MNKDDLQGLLNAGEGATIEYKQAQGGVPSSLYETVVSFANTDGGTILLGVDDDSHVIGIPADNAAQYATDIVTALNDGDCISPKFFCNPYTIEHDKGIVLALQVSVSSQVHSYRGNVLTPFGEPVLTRT